MADWNELWRDSDKLRRWAIPDHHFLRYVERIGEVRGLSALDLGCGIGRHAVHLARGGCHVDAVDASENALRHLAESVAGEDLPLTLHRSDLRWTLGCADAVYDIVVSWNVIYHGSLALMRKVLSEACRVLRPGGDLLLTLNSVRNIHFGEGVQVEPNTFEDVEKLDGDHLHHYSTRAEVQELLTSFDLIDLTEDEEEVGGRRFKDRWHWYIAASRPERRSDGGGP